jgi:hypothetical protein
MKPKLLLRIAAILILLHGVLHTIGFSSWKTAPDPVEQQVIQQMTGHAFPFMGATRSLGNYYDGFGYASSIALVLIAVLLWLVSDELSANTGLAKKVIMSIAFALLFWAVDECIYFFAFAAGLSFVASICSFWAGFKLMKQTAAAT